jgi:hypothetical protein
MDHHGEGGAPTLMDYRRRAQLLLGATLVATLVAALVAMIPARAAAQCDPPPGDAFAFLSLGNQSCPATPLVHWSPPGVTVDCSFLADGTHEVLCGESTAAACVQHCRQAVATWNTDLAGRFFLAEADAAHPVTFCDSADGRTSIGGSTQFCGGQAFGSNIVAVTLRVTIADGPQRGEQQDADIVLNPKFNSLFTAGFFRAVIEHELGHVIGLDHPDQCGRDANVLMRSAFRFADGDPCFVSVPTADDVNGATMIYPLLNPGPTPTPGPLCGDANGDGAVGVSDVATVLQAAVDLPSTCDALPVRCDVDDANGVDVIDAANVQRRALGLSSANACAF